MSNASGPMACPNDGATLVMSERSGIEIDYCPTCRGVWLDRGELDKIIERNAADSPAPPPPPAAAIPPVPPPPPQQQPWGQPPQHPYGGPGYGGYGHKPHKRRKSFLEELFD
jgi:Zn-finger nucleic acid-binding protein